MDEKIQELQNLIDDSKNIAFFGGASVTLSSREAAFTTMKARQIEVKLSRDYYESISLFLFR